MVLITYLLLMSGIYPNERDRWGNPGNCPWKPGQKPGITPGLTPKPGQTPNRASSQISSQTPNIQVSQINRQTWGNPGNSSWAPGQT